MTERECQELLAMLRGLTKATLDIHLAIDEMATKLETAIRESAPGKPPKTK